MSVAAMPTRAKVYKEPRCPSIDKWIYIPLNIMQPSKNAILSFAMTSMELEGIRLSKISQSEKENHHMISLICGI